MYPFDDGSPFLREAWYVAAFAHELNSGPIERVIMDEPVALFRMGDGTPTAMWGICPHRFYPLAKGKVTGDALQCGYHGFEFDGRSGACVKVPSQQASPSGFRQRIYPVVEHGPWIWIWPGNAANADRTLLPDLATMGVLAPDWRVDTSALLPTAGRAQLLVDNLMDLTHIAYLHAMSIDGNSFLKFPIQMREEGRWFVATRVQRTPWVAGFYDLLFGPHKRFAGEHVTETPTYYFSPAYILTNSGTISEIEGQSDVDRSTYGTVNFHHILTPETAHSTHYFSTLSRNFRLEDHDFSAAILAIDQEVRRQDVVAVGEIEERLQRFPPREKELLSKSDAAAARVRRMIQAQLRAEQAKELELRGRCQPPS
jgi:phenylpropionate dioxygenase-like ring-hydroxylating dioxygenase large terminal subunit